MKERNVLDKRLCYGCDSDKSSYNNWYENVGTKHYLCGTCNDRFFRRVRRYDAIPMCIRHCYACDSNKTWIRKSGRKKGQPVWFMNRPTKYVLCNGCYARIIRKEQRDLLNTYRVKFKNKGIWIGRPVRSGCCLLCKRTDRKTALHHIQYDEADVLAHTFELCDKCHGKETIKLGQIIVTKAADGRYRFAAPTVTNVL